MPQLMVHRVGTLDLLQFAQASILSAVQVLRQGSIERSHLHQRAMMSGNFAKNKAFCNFFVMPHVGKEMVNC